MKYPTPVHAPSHRRTPLWARVARALAVAAGATCIAAGCGMSASDAASFPSFTGGAEPADGGVAEDDASIANLPDAPSDAGAATSLHGSVLCNSHYSMSPCFPDEIPSGGPACLPAKPLPADAGADGNASASDGGPDPTIACHVVVNPDTQAVSPVCLAAGPKSAGGACLKSTDCASGYECVGNPGQCLHYCCSGECTDKDTFCDIEGAVGGAVPVSVPVCTAIRPCKLLTPDACDPGNTCSIVSDDGTTSCVALGPAKAGQACEVVHCAEGLTCLGHAGARTCYQLCRKSASTCSKGESCKGYAPTFRDVDLGVCQN